MEHNDRSLRYAKARAVLAMEFQIMTAQPA